MSSALSSSSWIDLLDGTLSLAIGQRVWTVQMFLRGDLTQSTTMGLGIGEGDRRGGGQLKLSVQSLGRTVLLVGLSKAWTHW